MTRCALLIDDNCTVVQQSDNATRHDCKNNDARRRGEGADVAQRPARFSSGEATPQQRPSQDGCIDARGPAQRRDRGARATQRPHALPSNHTWRNHGIEQDAAVLLRTTHASNAMRNLHAVEHTTSIKHAGRPRQDDARRRLAAGVERLPGQRGSPRKSNGQQRPGTGTRHHDLS